LSTTSKLKKPLKEIVVLSKHLSAYASLTNFIKW